MRTTACDACTGRMSRWPAIARESGRSEDAVAALRSALLAHVAYGAIVGGFASIAGLINPAAWLPRRSMSHVAVEPRRAVDARTGQSREDLMSGDRR